MFEWLYEVERLLLKRLGKDYAKKVQSQPSESMMVIA